MVIVLLDEEDDAACTLGPALYERASNASKGLPVLVVVARREFEGWLLAGAESLRGQCGLPLTLQAPEQLEEIRDAKEWLSTQLPAGKRYRERFDQPALASVVDLALAGRARSFARLCDRLESLLSQIGGD